MLQGASADVPARFAADCPPRGMRSTIPGGEPRPARARLPAARHLVRIVVSGPGVDGPTALSPSFERA